METKYLSIKETAQMVRQALKESFPGVKFSVKSHVYSGGSSINVGWTDGPTAKMVKSVSGVFTGAYFDGSIDYKGYTKAMIDGQMVSFGADFIFNNREFSDEFKAKAHAVFIRKFGTEFAVKNGKYKAQREERHLMHTMSNYLTPRKSKTAGKVIYCGNDGYSQVGSLSVE